MARKVLNIKVSWETLRNLDVYVAYMLSSPHYLPQCHRIRAWHLQQVATLEILAKQKQLNACIYKLHDV